MASLLARFVSKCSVLPIGNAASGGNIYIFNHGNSVIGHLHFRSCKSCSLASDWEIGHAALMRALLKRPVAASETALTANCRDIPSRGCVMESLECAEGSRARQLSSLSHISTSRLWICSRYAPRKPPMLPIAASGRLILSAYVVSLSERRAGRW